MTTKVASFRQTTTKTTTISKTKVVNKPRDAATAEEMLREQQEMLPPHFANVKLTLDDLDDLLSRLDAKEITELAKADPDDMSVPASLRCSYFCAKPPTPKLDRTGLLNSLRRDLSPDREEEVKFVPGTVRGKKFKKREKKDVPIEPESQTRERENAEMRALEAQLSTEDLEEYNRFFESATMEDLREMADILGVTYQDSCQATKLTEYPDPEPNESDVEAVVARAEAADPGLTSVNFNNIREITNPQRERLFAALASPASAVASVSLANCGLTDASAAGLAASLATSCLAEVTLDSNALGGNTILELLKAGKSLKVLRASNQSNCRFLGHRVELGIADLLSSGNNPDLVNLGINMEFRSCLNRVAVQLQKNLDKKRKSKMKLKKKEEAT